MLSVELHLEFIFIFILIFLNAFNYSLLFPAVTLSLILAIVRCGAE